MQTLFDLDPRNGADIERMSLGILFNLISAGRGTKSKEFSSGGKSVQS